MGKAQKRKKYKKECMWDTYMCVCVCVCVCVCLCVCVSWDLSRHDVMATVSSSHEIASPVGRLMGGLLSTMLNQYNC